MENVLNPNKLENDEFEISIRPKTLNEYIGQDLIKSNLKVFIKAAKMRDETLDHVLLYGPPGLGKTTLAQILANEMSTNIKITTGPSIEKSGDLAAILSALQEGDILFIDEIHRLPKQVEEVLYSAMEDFCLDIVVGSGQSAKSIRIDLPPFTLVGATTRIAMLSSPLRDRFGISFQLEFYKKDDIKKIIKRTSKVFDTNIEDEAIDELASRSRGTPRIANRLFRRIRDYGLVYNDGLVSLDIANNALNNLNVDKLGLDSVDIKYLKAIIERYNGGPVGLDAIAQSIAEEKDSLEDVSEPYLIQNGFINRTPRGRVVTEKAYKHLNIECLYKGNK